jgi:hypothetical protein
MKTIAPLALAIALAMSGVSAAAANQMSNHASSKMPATSDTLSLSGTQQKSIWKDVSQHAANQSAPSGFNATVGAAIPSSVNTYPLPRQARRDVPEARSYRYAMTQDKVLIVNPSDNKVADVVTK